MNKPNIDVVVSGAKQAECTYKNVVLKGNHSFASQVTEPNCIYVIKWDFDLNGETVTIPENCVLNFEGGSISNGTVVGTKTILSGKVEMENYSGVFSDYDGKPLTKDLRSFNPSLANEAALADYDFFPVTETNNHGHFQSLLIYRTDVLTPGTDKDYFIVLGIHANKLCAFVLDNNYFVCGYTVINTINHANGATIKDGYAYIVGRQLYNGTYYNNIAKVSCSDIIANCVEHNDTNYELVDMFNVHNSTNLYGISWNEQTKKWCILKDGYYEIYDSANVLVKQFTQSDISLFGSYIVDLYGMQQTYWDGYYIYQLVCAYGAPTSSALAIVSVEDEKVVSFTNLTYNCELEGLFYYNDMFFCIGQAYIQRVQYLTLYKITDMDFQQVTIDDIANSYDKNDTTINIYIDNSSTEPGTGRQGHPFKYISSAYWYYMNVDRVQFRIKKTDTPYNIGFISAINNKKFTGIKVDNVSPTIYGRVIVHGGVFELNDINLINIGYDNILVWVSERGIINASNTSFVGHTIHHEGAEDETMIDTLVGFNDTSEGIFTNCNFENALRCFNMRKDLSIYGKNTFTDIVTLFVSSVKDANVFVEQFGHIAYFGVAADIKFIMNNVRGFKSTAFGDTNAYNISINTFAKSNTEFDDIILFLNDASVNGCLNEINFGTVNLMQSSESGLGRFGLSYNRGLYKIGTIDNNPYYCVLEGKSLVRHTQANVDKILSLKGKKEVDDKMDYSCGKFITYALQQNFLFGHTRLRLTSWTVVSGQKTIQLVYQPLKQFGGTTRPVLDNDAVGYCYFDTSLDVPRPIWYAGNNVWVDATGATV